MTQLENQVDKNTNDIKKLRNDVDRNTTRINNLEDKLLTTLELINKKLDKIHGGVWSILQNVFTGGALVLVLILLFS